MSDKDKKCTKCGKIKQLDEFNFRFKSKGIYRSECKECRNEYLKEYRRNNKECIKERQKVYYLNNKEYKKEYDKEYKKAYRRNNRDKINVLNAIRRSSKRNAMVEDSNKNIINTFYEMSDRLSKCLGIQFHVDHLVPITKGGLHHENNLLPVPATVNLKKRDRIDLSHPFYSHLNFLT